MKKTDILRDPRYIGFVSRYHNDPRKFAIEVCEFLPTKDQEDLFEAIKEPNAKVSVVSGTSTGKTAAFGRIVLWHFLCFPLWVYDGKTEIGSNTYIAAPFIKTVADGVWKEIQDSRDSIAKNPSLSWINDYYEITKTRIYMKGYDAQWFVSQQALPKGGKIAVAGKHRYWQLFIVDEAAGVSDEHFQVINGTQSMGGNRTLLASQGVKNVGFFYDTHHTLAKENGGYWTTLVFDSEHSPYASDEYLKEIELTAGGKDTEEYLIRVKGEFTQNSNLNLMGRHDMDLFFDNDNIFSPEMDYGYVILVDVATGGYRDKSVVVIAKVCGMGEDSSEDARRVEFIDIPICSNSIQLEDLLGEILKIYTQWPYPTICVDNGGVGAGLVQRLERNGIPVKKINWGTPCFRPSFKEVYYNRRACGLVRFRNAIQKGRCGISAEMSPRLKRQIIDEGTRIPFTYAEAGTLRYKIKSKEEMKKDGISSPDIIDAMSFAFIEDCTYIPSGESWGNMRMAKENEIAKVDAFFDDVDWEKVRNSAPSIQAQSTE